MRPGIRHWSRSVLLAGPATVSRVVWRRELIVAHGYPDLPFFSFTFFFTDRRC